MIEKTIKWIPVIEELPTVSEGCYDIAVLICTNFGRIQEAWYYKDDKKGFHGFTDELYLEIEDVAYWAYMPEGPLLIELRWTCSKCLHMNVFKWEKSHFLDAPITMICEGCEGETKGKMRGEQFIHFIKKDV